MNETMAFWEQFNARVSEIEAYFNFVIFISEQKSINTKENKPFKIDNSLYLTLKANCFLMLYNLVESTVYGAVENVYDVISESQLNYLELCEEIKTIFIMQKTENLKDVNIKTENIIETVKAIVTEVADQNIKIKLNATLLKRTISGNVDLTGIDKIIKTHGFYGKLNKDRVLHIQPEQAFTMVKDKRNALAHGRMSFAEAAGEHTLNDLLTYKKIIITYLTDFLNNIDNYLNTQRYKKS